MSSLSSLSLPEFQKALTRQNVTFLQIIHIAIGAGVLVFLIALGVIAAGAGGSGAGMENGLQVVTWLTMISVVIALAVYGLAGWVYAARFSQKKLDELGTRDLVTPRGGTYSDPAEKALMLIRTASVLRLAMYEAAAMSGLVVLLLSVINGVLEANPWLWVNIIPTLVLFALIAFTFPTRDRLETVFRRHIQKAL